MSIPGIAVLEGEKMYAILIDKLEGRRTIQCSRGRTRAFEKEQIIYMCILYILSMGLTYTSGVEESYFSYFNQIYYCMGVLFFTFYYYSSGHTCNSYDGPNTGQTKFENTQARLSRGAKEAMVRITHLRIAHVQHWLS